jgi:hypothetical protein
MVRSPMGAVEVLGDLMHSGVGTGVAGSLCLDIRDPR